MSDIHLVKLRAELTGHICTQYAYFDYLVTNIIWHLLGIEKELGVIVTGNMDIRPKIEMALEVANYKEKFPEIREKLKSLKNVGNKPKGFISKRNIIVHGIISSRDNDPTVMVEAHRKKSLRSPSELPIEQYRETHDEIVAENQELGALMEAAGINVH